MFDIHEKVVYAGHGVARINRILEKNVAGVTTKFYELFFLNKDVTVLVPVDNANLVGLRKISSEEIVKEAFHTLAQPARQINHHEFAASSWNKRNKGYQLKLQTGSLRELSEIYRDLRFIGTQKPLSFGEKNLLSQAESLLVEEISLVQEADCDKIVEFLRESCLNNASSRQLR